MRAKVAQSRLFFALLPDPALASQLHKFSSSIKTRPEERISKPEMIHMTLRYIGPVDEETMQCLLSNVDNLKVSPFSIELTKLSYWKRAHVICCIPETVSSDLFELNEQLEKICQSCGIVAENRIFKPHVTLLKKSRELANGQFPELPVWQLNQFVLMESVTGKAGNIYNTLKSWALLPPKS